MRENIAAQVADYRGLLQWNAIPDTYIDGVPKSYPDITIPLYIKETSIPIRRPKITEINTIPTRDPMGDFNIQTQAVFFGTSEILQVNLSGWIITPVISGIWSPLATDGSLLYLGELHNVCYPEIISAFIEGRMLQGTKGSIQRKDPDKYISPHGDVYEGPVIGAFDWNFTVNKKKQTFNMTLWLEK